MRTFEDHMNNRINAASNSLRSKAESLQNNMEYLVKRIDKGDLDRINSLGEVQRLGGEVDTLCVELRTLMYTLADHKAFKEFDSE